MTRKQFFSIWLKLGWFIRDWWWCLLLTIIGAAMLVACLAGCAVGRGTSGEIVLGVDAGRLVETPGQALSAAATFLPPPWDYIATAAAGLLTAGGAAIARRRAADRAWDESRAEAERQRERENAAWDEATVRAVSPVAAVNRDAAAVKPVVHQEPST